MPADLPLASGDVLARVHTLARRLAQRSHLLFPVSALLMLVGCFIICAPYLKDLHDRKGLLILPLVLNTYEFLIIFACAWMIRRAPQSSEARTLFWIEVLFVLDLTFTVNACLPLHYGAGAFIAATITCQKLILLQAFSGKAIFGRLLLFFAPLLAFIYGCQGLLELYPAVLAPERRAMTFMTWLILALCVLFIPLALRRSGGDEDPDNAAAAGHWWAAQGFRRVLVLTFLAGALFQLGWQMWVHQSPISYMQPAPFIVALLCVFPALLNKSDPVIVSGCRAFILLNMILLGLFGLSHEAWPVRYPEGYVILSELRVALIFAGVAFWLTFLNERQAYLIQLSSFVLTLGLLGHDLLSMSLHLRHPSLSVPGALLIPAILWLRYELSFRRGLLVVGAWLLVACNAASRAWDVSMGLEFCRYLPLLALLWSLASRTIWPQGRLVCVTIIVGVGALGYRAEIGASLLYFLIAFATFAYALGLRRRSVLPLLCYALTPCFPRMTATAAANVPEISAGWLFVLLAFAVLGCALWVSMHRYGEVPEENEPSSSDNDNSRSCTERFETEKTTG